MAFVRLAWFPGGTAEHHAALAAALPSHDPPAGRLLFAAGPAPGGWQVVQVWESRAQLDAFNAAVSLAGVAAGAFPAPPAVTDFETVQLALGVGQDAQGR